MGNEVTTKTKTVSMMSAQQMYIDNIGKGLESIIGSMSKYQALCGYNVLNKINALLSKEGLNHTSEKVDKGSIADAIKFAIVYELNTDNNELFVMLRNKAVKAKNADGKEYTYWMKLVECKPQYRGQLKIISTYGRGVKKIYPEWIVREGDEFKYPTYKGVDVYPPEWIKKDSVGKIVRVVVPIQYNDDFIDYRIAERESIAVNIKAQIKQTLLGVKDESEVKKITALMKDKNLDQLLADETLREYINETYTGISHDEMIITKLIINATKRVPIEYKSALTRELLEKTFDNADVYKKNHTAGAQAENEQKQIEMKAVDNETGEILKEEEDFYNVKDQTLDEFMKEE